MTDLLPVDKGHCVSTEQKLLWNIQELLKELKVPDVVPLSKVEEKDQPTETKVCIHCGGTHDNKGQALACAKKHKKKGSAKK